MPIAKNAFTTSAPIRRVRRAYRHGIRPAFQDVTATIRSTLLRGIRSNTPDYLIVGVNKAGTTSLQEYLTGLPEVGKPLTKELHYFDRFPTRSLEWYRAQFWGDSGLTWGEATPEYFELPGAVLSLAEMSPRPKIIVCLRNPFARAVSHYHNAVDHASETRSIWHAFIQEAEALASGRRAKSAMELRNAYLQRSLYAEPLERWRSSFGRDLLVVRVDKPQAMVQEVLHHLNLTQADLPRLPGSNSRSYAPPPPHLREAFEPLLRVQRERIVNAAGWSEWPVEWE